MKTEKHKIYIQLSNREPEPEKPYPKKKTDNNISQFGILRKNNSFSNRSSWIDSSESDSSESESSETPSFQTPVPVKKKKPNTKKKPTYVKETSLEEANIKESFVDVRRLVKNPFKTSSSKETFKSSKVCELSQNLLVHFQTDSC